MALLIVAWAFPFPLHARLPSADSDQDDSGGDRVCDDGDVDEDDGDDDGVDGDVDEENLATPLLTSQPSMLRARPAADSVPSSTKPKPPFIT